MSDRTEVPSGCDCGNCADAEKRESAIEAMVAKGYTRERALEIFSLLSQGVRSIVEGEA